jgi:hypothetical protein
MAQVLPALAAQKLNPVSAIRIKWVLLYILPYLCPETREAGAYFKFIPGTKQNLPAVRASIKAAFIFALLYFASVPEHTL